MTPIDRLHRARRIAGQVVDPEIPVLALEDLGVVRDVRLVSDVIEVDITPTYSGCPAMHIIALDIELALDKAGLSPARVKTVLSPAWTTDWLSSEGHRKLAAEGIAPPQGASRRALFGFTEVVCPHCRSHETEEITLFGSTACKALWRCRSCKEPFDHFKCH